MSKPRPFIRYNQSTSAQDSSDRTTRLKQRTMYAALANNVTNWGEKTNGSVKYLGNYKNKKKNIKYSEPTVTESGCLVNAPSSSSFLDLSKGMYYCHRNDIQRDYTMNLSGKSWQGPFLQIDTGMVPGVTTWFRDTDDTLMAKFNAISTPTLISEVGGNPSLEIEQNLVDPNYDLFYEPCISEDNEPFRSYYKYANTEVYKDTYPYLEAIKKRYLKGFSFPSAVKFNYTEQLSGFKTEAHLTASVDDSGTLTITLDIPGSGYTTKPTAILSADNTDWYGCATSDEIGTPSSDTIFTYDSCDYVTNKGGLLAPITPITPIITSPIFCNDSFNIIIGPPPEAVDVKNYSLNTGAVFNFTLGWSSDKQLWEEDINFDSLVDLTNLNDSTHITLAGGIIVKAKPDLIKMITPGVGFYETPTLTVDSSTSIPFVLSISAVNCSNKWKIINIGLDEQWECQACSASDVFPSNSYYTINPTTATQSVQATGFGTLVDGQIQINVDGSGGIGYSDSPISVKLGQGDPTNSTIYDGVDLIDYVNTLLKNSLHIDNKGQLTLNNSTTGTLIIQGCTFNNTISYSVDLSGTTRRYAKDIEQTCGAYCHETPKLCDPDDTDSSNYIHLPCDDDPKWTCCNTKTINTLSSEPEPEPEPGPSPEPEPEPECVQFNARQDLQTAVDAWNSNPVTATTNYGPISCWDVSKITNMDLLFFNMNNFNDDISAWDVSNVTTMVSMFSVCTTFNHSINKWDVSKVTDMSYMFYNCIAYDQSMAWTVNNVIDMSYMFYNCTSLEQDMGEWFKSDEDTAVINMTSMFYGCTKMIFYDPYDLSQNKNLEWWATVSQKASSYMLAPTGANYQDDTDYILTITDMFNGANLSAKSLVWWNDAMDLTTTA